MTDLVERLRDRAVQFDSGYARDLTNEAATELAELRERVKEYQQGEEELRELLCSFVKEHCDPIPEWRPLADMRGMISQFDNATTVTREIKARAETAERERDAAREGLTAAIRAAKLAVFTINKQGVMPNSSWESGFNADLKTAEDAARAITGKE